MIRVQFPWYVPVNISSNLLISNILLLSYPSNFSTTLSITEEESKRIAFLKTLTLYSEFLKKACFTSNENNVWFFLWNLAWVLLHSSIIVLTWIISFVSLFASKNICTIREMIVYPSPKTQISRLEKCFSTGFKRPSPLKYFLSRLILKIHL